MGFFKNMIKPMDGEENLEAEYQAASTSYAPNYEQTNYSVPKEMRAELNNNPQTGAYMRAAAGAGSEIVLVEAKELSSAQAVANAFKRGATVICDLTNMNSNDFQRTLDFISGVSYVLNGKFIRVSREIFMLMPQNVAYHKSEQASTAAPTTAVGNNYGE